MAGRALVVIGMLTLAVTLPVSRASADPIRITAGSMIADDRDVGSVDIQGTQGFKLRLDLDLSDERGPWNCSPCGPPGTSKSLSGFFTSGAGSGTVQLDGASYPVPDQAEVFLRPVGGPVILPPLSAGAVLSAPFELNPGALSLHDVGGVPLQEFTLIGSGTATIELTPNQSGVPVWEFVRVRYEFSPVPEPTSVLLLGTGMLALAAKRPGRQ